MKLKKRVIAMALAVLMIVSTCPISTWAEETPQEEISTEAVPAEEASIEPLPDENNVTNDETILTEELLEEPTAEEPVVLSSGDFLYTEVSDGTFSICGYTGEAAEDDKPVSVEIPASIDDVAVTQIGEKAFADNEIIEAIILPENIAYIDNDAFAGCSSLKAIAFCGDTLEGDSSIIKGCNELEKIFILSDKDLSAFLELIMEDLGEETAKQVETLEYEDIDKLKTAYD